MSPAPANGHLDTGSQEAFPSLAPSPVSQSANKPAGSAWGSSAGPRIRPAVTKQIMFSDSFILSSSDIATAGRDGKPISLGQVMKQVMVQHKVKIEASTNQKSRQTTFFLKAEYQKDLDKAKRSLLALLSPVVRIPISKLKVMNSHSASNTRRTIQSDVRILMSGTGSACRCLA